MNLETLYILFRADTDDLKKGLKEAEKEIGKLESSLKRTDKSAEKVGGSFLKFTQSAAGFAATSAAAIYSISHFKSALDFGVNLSQTSRLLNVNTTDLQAWGNAVELAGGDAAQFQNTLKGLASKFGTSPATALKALPLYSDLFHKLSPARAQQVGHQLGFDEGTILLLQQGRREVEDIIKRQKELGLVTEHDSELFNKFRVSLVATKQASQVLFNHLAADALPILIKLQKIASESFLYADKHRGVIEGTTAALGVGSLILLLKSKLGRSALSKLGPLGAVFAANAAYEDISSFFKGNSKTALGAVTGVGSGGFQSYAQKVNKAKEENSLINFSTKILETLLFFRHKSSLNFNPNTASLLGISPLLTNGANAAPQINYNLGPTTINTQANDGEGLLTSLQNYTNGHFAQATNFYSQGTKA